MSASASQALPFEGVGPIELNGVALFSKHEIGCAVNKALPVTIFTTDQLTLLTSKHRPGGSSSSIGFVRHVATGKTYLAKGDYMSDDQLECLRNILQEICSNDVYGYFGCHAQRLAMCELPWIMGSNCWRQARRTGEWLPRDPASGECTVPEESHLATACNGDHGVNPVDVCGKLEGPHLITEWIEGFSPFDADLVAQLATEAPSEALTVRLPSGQTVPVVGIGQILAVAALVNDVDCLGNAGANVGYTVLRNEDNTPVAAKAVKIDPGFAFTDCVCPLAVDAVQFRDTQSQSLDRLAAGEMYVGTNTTTSYDKLPRGVQQEFLSEMASVLRATAADLQSLFSRPGLAALFANEAEIALRVDFLVQRQSALRAAYEQLLHTTESSAIDVRAAHKRGYAKDVLLRDPVTLELHPIEERFVHLSLLRRQEAESDAVTASASPAAGGAGGPAPVTAPSLWQRMFGSGPALTVQRELMVNSFEAVHADRVSVELSQLSELCKGGRTHINVIGGAGIGKSTFCQCVVNQWAKGALLQEYELLLWVPLRRLTSDRYPSGDEYDAVAVIIRECLNAHPTPELRAAVAAVYNPAACLWILDGYDEIVGRVPPHLQSVFDHMMSAPNRLLTGRPNAMTGLPCDAEVEIAGFTDENIADFTQRFARDPTVATQLLQQLKNSKIVWELAHIPVNLVLLCHVFRDASERSDGEVDGGEQQLTLTELYERVEKLLLRRYCARQGHDLSILGDAAYSVVSQPVLDALCDLAFDAMQDGIVMLSESRLVGILPLIDADPAAAKTKLMDSGFLVQVGDGNFHFLHLTLQEYFAAQRAALALSGLKPLADAAKLEWLRVNKDAPHFEVVWWFVAGLLAISRFATLPPVELKRVDLPTCTVCSAKFSLFKKRYHCKRCGTSVCAAHSETWLPLRAGEKPLRHCDNCLSPATWAIVTMSEWWTPFFADCSSRKESTDPSQVKLWLQLSEQGRHILAAAGKFEAVHAFVEADVVRWLKDATAKKAGERPWFSTLQLCREVVCQRLLREASVLTDELQRLASASSDTAEHKLRVLRLVEGIGPVVLKVEWMRGLLRGLTQNSLEGSPVYPRAWEVLLQLLPGIAEIAEYLQIEEHVCLRGLALCQGPKLVELPWFSMLKLIAILDSDPENGWYVARSICLDSAAGCQFLVASGFLDCVVPQLERHRDRSDVLGVCLGALQSLLLLSHYTAGSTEYDAVADTCGRPALQNLLQGLSSLERAPHVAQTALGLLKTIHGTLTEGRLVRKLAVKKDCLDLAISPDGSEFAMLYFDVDSVFIYACADGRQLRTFGGQGQEPGKFYEPARLVYHPVTGMLIVTEISNRRVQEVKHTGEHVRFIGAGVIGHAVSAVATNGPLVAVGKYDGNLGRGTNNRVMLFEYASGAHVRSFGEWGEGVGQLGQCLAMKFAPDGRNIVVAQYKALSVFTTEGSLVREVGRGTLRFQDVEFAPCGDWIVCDRNAHHVVVLSGEDGRELRRWGGEASFFGSSAKNDGKFKSPTALALSASGQLWVGESGARVQVFE